MKKKQYILWALAFLLLCGALGCAPAAPADAAAPEPTAVPTATPEPAPEPEPEEEEEEATAPHPGTIRGKVLMDNGMILPCGIVVIDEDGHSYLAFTNPQGGYNLKLTPGTYTLRFTRGPEYSVVEKTVSPESYKIFYEQDVRLVKLHDAYEKGWHTGDLHQHTYYSDGTSSVEGLLNADIAAGLAFGFLSDHNTARGCPEWIQGNRIATYLDDDGNARLFQAFEAVEVTTEYGHYQSLGIGLTFDTYEVLLHDIERAQPSEVKDEIVKERIIYIAETIKRLGGVAQINHPYSANVMGFPHWDLYDHFDTIEIWNGMFNPGDGRYESDKSSSQTQNYRSKIKWFELLNTIKDGGKFIAATCGTDNHEVSAPYNGERISGAIASMDEYQALFEQTGKYCGVPSIYLNIRGERNLEGTLDAIRAGHSFLSNGIFLLCSVDGATYGDTVALNGRTDVQLDTDIWCRDGVTSVRVTRNGETYLDLPLDGATSYATPIVLEGVAPTDWIVMEAFGDGTLYAITNPIFFAE